MKIQKCTICGKPFFPTISTTSETMGFDPAACPQCNMDAIRNSQAPVHNTQTF